MPVRRSSKLSSLTTWEEAETLLGDWVLDEGASDSQDGLYELFELGWTQRQALGLVKQARTAHNALAGH